MRDELTSLEMGAFTDQEVGRIGEIIGAIDMDQPAMFSSFGSLEKSGQSLDEVMAMLEDAPVTRLSGKLAEIVGRLQDADPRQVAKKPTFLARAFGAAVENKVRYQAARKGIETLIEEAERMAEGVRKALGKVDALIDSHNEDMSFLRAHIAAGRLFLARNPEAGRPLREELSFENNRERFARRLANLAALASSQQMSEVQLRLSRSQGFDMLDRFAEVTQVLIPVWRQHSLSLMNSSREDPQLIAAANKAHDALVAGLASSLDGLQKQA